MKLYHGTTEKVVEMALTEGLKPRGDAPGNWAVVSHPDAVYLTTTYAAHYAKCADGERWGIVEVDTVALNHGLLAPDEDYLEQLTRGHHVAGMPADVRSMQERNKWFRDRLRAYMQGWESSVYALGNCCYFGVIPPGAIVRATVFDPVIGHPVTRAVDPEITLANQRLLGAQYRAVTRWLMGDVVTGEELNGMWWKGMDDAERGAVMRGLADRQGWARLK